jgi:hypothetical protein
MEGRTTIRAIRLFMVLEAVSFITAALVHSGVLVSGYEHRRAHAAEAVIAIVLVLGLTLGWIRSIWTRKASMAAQAFALSGTMLGVTMIAIGVGPRTVSDIAYHIDIVIVLVWGLYVCARMPRH